MRRSHAVILDCMDAQHRGVPRGADSHRIRECKSGRHGNEEFTLDALLLCIASVMVFGQMNETSGVRLRVALTALAMSEYFRDQGMDVLLFIDNIFRFTQAGSEVSALLGRMPSAVGYQPTLAEEMGVALPSVKKALVSGEAFPPSLRDWFAARAIQAYQCYATADVGLIAYETIAREGLVVDEGVILEIVRPGTGDPVSAGEVGELVITTFNPDYPMIRFGTGDLSAALPGPCPTGRTNARIKGWMGRADQTTKVRGMFIHASQVADIMRKFPSLSGKARLVVTGAMANDHLTLHVEGDSINDELITQLGGAVRDVTKLRADITVVSPGALPNDGKVIEDARSYD